MNCKEPKFRKIILLRDILSDEERINAIDRHMEGCADCFSFYKQFRLSPGLGKNLLTNHIPINEIIECSGVASPASITEEERERIEFHLLLCSSCRQEVRAVRAAKTEFEEFFEDWRPDSQNVLTFVRRQHLRHGSQHQEFVKAAAGELAHAELVAEIGGINLALIVYAKFGKLYLRIERLSVPQGAEENKHELKKAVARVPFLSSKVYAFVGNEAELGEEAELLTAKGLSDTSELLGKINRVELTYET